jgi:hypothetical protein
MRRISVVTGLLLMAVGLLLAYGGNTLKLKGQYGPGPGFTAFWIGVPLAVLSAVWLVQLLKLQPGAAFISEQGGLRRVVTVILSLVAFAVLLVPLGFDVAMLALLLFLFFAFNREHWVAKVLAAVGGSFGVHYAFEHYLRVPLPYSSIDVLQSLGL